MSERHNEHCFQREGWTVVLVSSYDGYEFIAHGNDPDALMGCVFVSTRKQARAWLKENSQFKGYVSRATVEFRRHR